MIVAITGSSGFIGKKLVSRLLSSDHEIIKLDITEGINILDWNVLKKVNHFDVLVHLAAMSYVPLSYETPRDFYNLNINGVINGLELCRCNNAKFVFASSYVYGVPEFLPITEDHPLSGFNPYAETKIIGEKICEDYYKYFGVKSIILRSFNIYGEGQNKKFLIPMIIDQAKTGKVILKDPRPKRDFVYIDDVVDCFIKATENDSLSFDIFNIGYGKSYSVQEVVEFVNHFYNNCLEIEYTKEERNIEVMDTLADVSKARKVLGWSPKIDLFSGIKKMYTLHE